MEQSLGKSTVLEIGYLGSGGFHLQRAHLINNAQPGPGLIQPRRPFKKISFVPNTVSAAEYHGGEHDVRREHDQPAGELGAELVRRGIRECAPTSCQGAQLPGELHLVEESVECAGLPFADVRVVDSAEQNDLEAEKGPACDVRHRFALSAVYDVPTWASKRLTQRHDAELAGARRSSRRRADFR